MMEQGTENNKKLWDKTLVVTSAVCLLPLVMSAAVYRDLPQQVAIHWNSSGTPDGYAPRAMAAFGLPLLMLVINLFCHLGMNSDPKRRGQSRAAATLGKWCVPVLSLILVPLTLLIALGMEISVSVFVPCLVGVLLIALGNYLPKCRQNYTIGIKLPWTLHDEDNWDRTHRMAGWLWMLGGILFLAGGFLHWNWLCIAVIAVIVLVPAAYSFVLYLKKRA